MYINSKGIVLHSAPAANGSKLISVYTLEHGKIRAVAEGARKSVARLMMTTEPIVESEFMFYCRSLSSAYMKVIGGRLNCLFPVLKTDFKKYLVACQVAEVVNSMTCEHVKNENKYYLIKRTLELIETSAHPRRIYSAFLLRFMNLCGYGLQIDECVMCSEQQGHFRLSTLKSGLLCARCSGADTGAIDLEATELRYLRRLSRFSGEAVDDLEATAETDRIIEGYCNLYLFEYLQKPLKTMEFLMETEVQL